MPAILCPPLLKLFLSRAVGLAHSTRKIVDHQCRSSYGHRFWLQINRGGFRELILKMLALLHQARPNQPAPANWTGLRLPPLGPSNARASLLRVGGDFGGERKVDHGECLDLKFFAQVISRKRYAQQHRSRYMLVFPYIYLSPNVLDLMLGEANSRADY